MQKTRYFFVYSAVIVLLIGVTVHVILQSEGSFNQVGARFNELDPKVRWDLVNLIEITLSQIRKVGLAVPMRITMLRRPEQGRNLFRKPFLSGDTREVKAVHYISSTVENWCMGSGLSTAVTKYEHGDHDILVRFDCNMPTTRSPSKGYILLGIGAVMFASLSLAIVSMRLKQEMVAKLAIEYNEHEIELPTEPSKPGNDSEREAENAKSTNSADVLEKCSIEVVKHPENPEDGEEDAALLEDFDIIDMKEASVR